MKEEQVKTIPDDGSNNDLLEEVKIRELFPDKANKILQIQQEYQLDPSQEKGFVQLLNDLLLAKNEENNEKVNIIIKELCNGKFADYQGSDLIYLSSLLHDSNLHDIRYKVTRTDIYCHNNAYVLKKETKNKQDLNKINSVFNKVK